MIDFYNWNVYNKSYNERQFFCLKLSKRWVIYNVESSENLYFKSYAIGRLVGIGIFCHEIIYKFGNS